MIRSRAFLFQLGVMLFIGAIAVPGSTATSEGSAYESCPTQYMHCPVKFVWQPSQTIGSTVDVDGHSAIVGAPDFESTGVAYVYERDRTTPEWRGPTKLRFDNPLASGARAGYKVAISAVDHGNAYAVVAAFSLPNDDGNRHFSAYVFERMNGHWSENGKLFDVLSSFSVVDLAIFGDTVVVGSYAHNTAYVFTRDRLGKWGFSQKIEGADIPSTPTFGRAVAVSEDYIVLGAHDQKAAYVFARNQGGRWRMKTKLTPERSSSESFGYSVAISTDSIIVGAPILKGYKGSAYIFTIIDGSKFELKETLNYKPKNSWLQHPEFGTSVDIYKHVAIVGNRGTNSGTVFVYKRGSKGSNSHPVMQVPAELGNDDEVKVGISGDGNAVYVFADALRK